MNPALPLAANFAGQILLTGYDSINESAPLHPGDSLPLTFYWAAQSPPGRNLNLFIHLVEPATQTQVAGFDGPPPFPTQFWPAGAKIVDARTLKMPEDLPPGTYNLVIGWYNLEDFARLPLTGANSGDSLLLHRVTVE
ncbi:MAG: hypothetical protein D6768_11300 [Chloroflexi bacterium]|nr:MAG: hypothetical protein D6768_11300 [Chloroflexota bacterium]